MGGDALVGTATMTPYISVDAASLIVSTGPEVGDAHKGLFKVTTAFVVDQRTRPRIFGRRLDKQGRWLDPASDLSVRWDWPNSDLLDQETLDTIKKADAADAGKGKDDRAFGMTSIRTKQPSDANWSC